MPMISSAASLNIQGLSNGEGRDGREGVDCFTKLLKKKKIKINGK